jgi:maltooligosyltrehalose trehalohydrolase
MPFGAAILDDRRVRFRLWAPAAHTVDLSLDDGQGQEDILPMERLEDGWFELVTGRAAEHTRYRYRIDGGLRVPDPASRYNPLGTLGPSEVVEPASFDWDDADWVGRPWNETALYELHVGAFTPQGTYGGLESKLDYLADLGITAIELMPLASFPGWRDWGYDGVLLFAPASCYGRPEQLKRLVQAAHRKGLMVFLDVVYNHFGPEGNYLHVYAPQFFSDRHPTRWGAAINFDGPASCTVRDFFMHNALYWLQEFHFDGLRLDAVHAITDDSNPDFLTQLADAVQHGPGRERSVHLVLENDLNHASRLARDVSGRPRHYVAQWNDDIHHAFHVLLTNETEGHYVDYVHEPVRLLGRSLTQGFAYQGETSTFRGSVRRGEPCAHLPPTAFVSFLQNHDQIGNRALGERLGQLVDSPALTAAIAILLLAPSPPLLFMGEEFGAATPFLFFCDFSPDFAEKVDAGRRQEFARSARFDDAAIASTIPDPCAVATFERSKLDWSGTERPPHAGWLRLYRTLLAVRRREIVPLLTHISGGRNSFQKIGERGIQARWDAGTRGDLVLLANLGEVPRQIESMPEGRLLYSTVGPPGIAPGGILPPWSATWLLAQNSHPKVAGV